MKQCTNCNTNKEIAEFYKARRYKDGIYSICKVCSNNKTIDWMKKNEVVLKQTTKDWRIRNKSRQKIYEQRRRLKDPSKTILSDKKKNSASRAKYNIYKSSSIKRNLEFQLSFDEFMTFWQSNCYYCKEIFDSIRIDRLDNNKGYILDNCVPCCWDCNRMKNKYSLNEFRNKIEKLYFNLQQLKTIHKE